MTQAAKATQGITRQGMKTGQFVHEQCYALTKGNRTPTEGGGWTGRHKANARDVVGEVLRDAPEHYRHLTAQGLAPMPPVWLDGVDPAELRKELDALARKVAKIRGTKKKPNRTQPRFWADGRVTYSQQRISETVLGTCIASWPGKPDNGNADYLEWKRLTAAWMRKRYGRHLIGIYEHVDEPHGHLHALFHNGGHNVKPLLAGHSAANDAVALGLSRKEAQDAMDAANIALQDSYQEEVGARVGLARNSAHPKPRKSLGQAHRDKAKLELIEAQRERAEAKAARKKAEQERQEAERDREAASRLLQERIESRDQASMLLHMFKESRDRAVAMLSPELFVAIFDTKLPPIRPGLGKPGKH